MPVTKGGLIPPIIQKARVLDVDLSTYTLSVATEYAKKPMSGISFATPYQHLNNGEGIYFMPEVGSVCWLCEPSDGCMPFVLAWASAQNEADFTSQKKQLNPGDIYLGTRDDNFLFLRRGGVVQIGATGICQRIFMPVNNTISDFCENYGLHTLAGDLEWTIGRTDQTTDGRRPGLLKVYAKEFADDPGPVAELEIGSHSSDSDTILTLKIRDKGGGQEQVSLTVKKTGEVDWVIQKDLSEQVNGDWGVSVAGDIAITGKKKITLSATGDFKAHTDANATLEAQQVTVDAPMTKMTGVTQANGGLPVALAPALLMWLGTHTHNIVLPAPGSPTSPPVAAPPGSIASGNLFSS